MRASRPRYWAVIVLVAALAFGLAPRRGRSEGEGAAAPPAATPAAAPAHPSDKGEPAAEGEGSAKATPTPPQPGPPLNGFFDLTVLRAAERVAPFRQPLEPIEAPLSDSWRAEIRCTLEFGGTSGVAEVAQCAPQLTAELRDTVSQFPMLQLITLEGKLRLKEALVQAINRHLKTAQVRKIYFTEFRIGR